jgi:hypothetical protein
MNYIKAWIFFWVMMLAAWSENQRLMAWIDRKIWESLE